MLAFSVERENGDLSHLEEMIEEGANHDEDRGEDEEDDADHDGFWAQMRPEELRRLEAMESTGRVKELSSGQKLRVSLREKLFASGVVRPRAGEPEFA
jgi:ATPase subunit of ABC transporter with duplicated ATPase domains